MSRAKSWLIVRSSELTEKAQKVFGVKIMLKGRRDLCAVIRSKGFKDQYCLEKVDR